MKAVYLCCVLRGGDGPSPPLAPAVVDPLIANGKDSDRDEFPWQVSLQFYDAQRMRPWTHVCGGALIDRRWVLTAARCLSRPKRIWRIALGKNNLQKDEPGQVFRFTAGFFPHPEYDRNKSSSHDFDIGLVLMGDSLKFSVKHPNIRPIEMLRPDEEKSVDREHCAVAGWGVVDSKQNRTATVLQKAQVKVHSEERCRVWFSSINLMFDKRMLCALAVTRGNIEIGDAGGALVCPVVGRSVVVGIANFGLSTDEPMPSIYAKVTPYLGWIEATMKQLKQGKPTKRVT